MRLTIVGAGLTGATIARLAADRGVHATICERRNHPGGNLKDEIHPESGWKIHKYGPHFFRTSSEEIWQFVNRFSDWFKFEATMQSYVNDKLVPWPPSEPWLIENYGYVAVSSSKPNNFKEACLERFPIKAYEDLIAGYVRKQWGVEASELEANVLSRIEVRKDASNLRLKSHKYQALPSNGYDTFIHNILSGIEVFFNTRTIRNMDMHRDEFVIFTGAIDEFFGYDLGKLHYRSQKREHSYSEENYELEGNPTCIVYPNCCEYIRSTKWNEICKKSNGFLATYETPYTPTNSDEYEYPFPSSVDRKLYEQYAERAQAQFPNVLFAGRLGSYAYYDMDQAIGRAMMLFEKRIWPKLKGD